MAIVRGVENGFTVVRSAQEGFITVSDAYGHVLAEKASATEPDARLVLEIPAGPGATFYTRYGDWFGWTNVAMLPVFLLWMLKARHARLM